MTCKEVKLSVIIPCFNAAATIGAQLVALGKQSWSKPWELIVVDNRSTDNSMAVVKSYMKRMENLRLIDASDRQGQPNALNTGAKVARGEALAFIDADDEVAPGWLASIGEALEKHDFVACRVDTAKLNPAWLTKTRDGQSETELKAISYPPYLPHSGTGTLGVKRALFEAFGGFDESLPYLHDTDLCFRLQLAGHELNFVPQAVVHIRLREKPRDFFRQARLWAEYNVLVYKRYRRPDASFPFPWRRHARQWVRLLTSLPQLRRKDGRAKYIWSLGWQVGRVVGSVKHRVPPV